MPPALPSLQQDVSVQEHSLGHADVLSLPSHSRSQAELCTTGKVALQGGVSIWAAEGPGEVSLGSEVTEKDWGVVLGKVRRSQHGRYLTDPPLSVSRG